MDLMTETEVRDVAGGGVESLMDADGRWRVPAPRLGDVARDVQPLVFARDQVELGGGEHRAVRACRDLQVNVERRSGGQIAAHLCMEGDHGERQRQTAGCHDDSP